MQIFHSVNAGLFLQEGMSTLLVDAIPCDCNTGFSPMPHSLRRELELGGSILPQLEGLLFTHLHADHFGPDMLRQLLRNVPQLSVCGPGLAAGMPVAHTLFSKGKPVCIGNWSILGVPTTHEGKAFAQEAHRSLLIQNGDLAVFISGDAMLGPKEAALLEKQSPQLAAAFLNPFQLLTDSGLTFLRLLMPKVVYLYHLPLPEHDRLGCFALARRAEKGYPLDLPVLRRLKPMSWIRILPS